MFVVLSAARLSGPLQCVPRLGQARQCPCPTPLVLYVETVQTGNLLFFSGMLPVVDHKPKYLGRVIFEVAG